MKVKKFFKRLIAGMGIGVGAAIPGVSGAAIAVIFKVYEEIIHSINNIFKQFLKSLLTLLPVIIGIIVAVIPCIILFDKALENFVFGLLCIFAGLLIGSIPSVTKEIKGAKFTKKSIFAMIFGILIVLFLGGSSIILGSIINLNSMFENIYQNWWLFIILIPVGFVAAVALTVPGLSGSLILLIIGFYKPLLGFTIDWTKEMLGVGVEQSANHILSLFLMLFTFAIGCLLGVLTVSKIMSKLLDAHHDITYFTILGFIIGSILVLFFNYNIFIYYLDWANVHTIFNHQFYDEVKKTGEVHHILPMYIEMIIGFLSMIVAGVGSFFLTKLADKKKIINY